MLRPLLILSFLTSFAVAEEAPEKTPSHIDAAITRGVDFLIQHQNKNGSWGSSRRTKGLNIFSPLPDGQKAFHVASSALALHGMLECGDRRPETIKSIEKGEKWLLSILPQHRSINLTATYNIWAHAYGLRALSSFYRKSQDPEKRKEYIRQAKIQISKLQRQEDVNKGWGYYDFDEKTSKPSGTVTSFTSATIVLAMYDAATTMGIELSPVLMKRSLDLLRLQRTADFSYVYSHGHRYYPRSPINRPAGSLGRSQSCNAATRVLGDEAVTDEVLRIWLKRLFDRNGWLDIGRKRPIPHESHAAVAGYFYYYGHYYASQCITMLPENERGPWKEKLATLLISKQEKNGSWWDFPLYNYHYAYCTGYVLASLGRCND